MILKNASVFIGERFEMVDIAIEDGKIKEIGQSLCRTTKDEIEMDYTGRKIIPGMVEIHSHGCLGYDFCTATQSQMNEMRAYYASQGTTALLATVMTGPKDVLRKAMKEVKNSIEEVRYSIGETEECKTRIMGINLEGPFFGEAKKGAHDVNCLLQLDEEFIDELQALSGNHIQLLDVDPTLNNALYYIEKYSKQMTVSIAHTVCNYELANKAIAAGATHITHLFNAMNPLHHRDSGLIGAFSDNQVNAELICDGFHVHPSVIRMMYKVAGDRILLISDSISAMGLPDGHYISGGLDIAVKNGEATLENGTIAGSTISLLEGVRRVISYGISEEEAILGATMRPAKAVGIDAQVGSIEVGKCADLLVVDNQYNIEKVFISGIE